MRRSLPFLTAVILGVTLLAFTAPPLGVSLKTMKANMLDDLNGTVNGYAFVIKKGATTRTGPGAGPSAPWMAAPP